MNRGKVWTIDAPSQRRERGPSPGRPPSSGRPEVPRAADAWARRPSARKAYLFGPVLRAVTSEGVRRVGWTLAGPGAILVGVALWIWRAPLRRALESVPHGELAWIAIGSIVIVSIVTTWAAAIASARQIRPVRMTRRVSWILRPPAATLAGLLVPGLGLMLAGKRKLAAVAFWVLAPIAAATFALAQWRWIAGRSGTGDSAVPASPVGEIVLAAAFLVLTLSVFAWIIQALDGARRASWGRDGRPGALSLALVLVLAVFAATFRSHNFARNLDAQASALRDEGLRLIPWVLCEGAAHLDPLNPFYQVRAAELAAGLGMEDAARVRRESLRKKTEEWNLARQALPDATPPEARTVADAASDELVDPDSVPVGLGSLGPVVPQPSP